MKKLSAILLTICLSLALGASVFASAAEKYPEDDSFSKKLVFTSLADYAVSDGSYAFAHEQFLSVYKDHLLVTFEHTQTVSRVEPYNGGYCFRDGAGGVYAVTCEGKDGDYYSVSESDKLSAEEAEKAVFSDYNAEFTCRASGGEYVLALSDNSLAFRAEGTTDMTKFDGQYSRLKKYGETAYVIKENALYSLNRAEKTPLSGADGSLYYMDYGETEKIEAGGVLNDIQSASMQFVTLKAGAHYSEIDLDSLTAQTATLPVDKNKTSVAAGGEVALLICRTGDSAIISIGKKSYVMLGENAEDSTLSAAVADFTPATGNVIVDDACLYFAPHYSEGTKKTAVPSGVSVNVKAKFSHAVLDYDYYAISYESDGETIEGYIPAGFIFLGPAFADENPTPVADPDYSEADVVRTVVLIIVVVALVLVAAGYVIYVATADKRRKKAPLPSDGSASDDKS